MVPPLKQDSQPMNKHEWETGNIPRFTAETNFLLTANLRLIFNRLVLN